MGRRRRDGRSGRRELVRLLQHAYSGEQAAALAYEGHWRSVPAGEQRARIRNIMDEERAHRRLVGDMLAALGARPQRLRELLMPVVGSTVAVSCFLGGRSVPMVGAGRIEHANVKEYERAARLARSCGPAWMAQQLECMADVEREHERWFLEQALSSRIGRFLAWQPHPSPTLGGPGRTPVAAVKDQAVA